MERPTLVREVHAMNGYSVQVSFDVAANTTHDANALIAAMIEYVFEHQDVFPPPDALFISAYAHDAEE
jgi:hypothetical protein